MSGARRGRGRGGPLRFREPDPSQLATALQVHPCCGLNPFALDGVSYSTLKPIFSDTATWKVDEI